MFTQNGAKMGDVHLLNVMYFVPFLTKLGKVLYKHTINIIHENIVL